MEHTSIEKEILSSIWPSDDEVDRAIQQFQIIQDYIDKEFSRDAKLMGSLAKRTFISGDKDLDIFVFFPPKTSEDQLEEQGLEIGKAVFQQFDGDYHIEYADHPYTKGTINGYEVEIVPAIQIDDTSKKQSAVDRTPFHTDWVNDTLNPDQRKETVLLKAFLKGQGLYGSTLVTEGFSGYLCELLIATYGSFKTLLKNAQNWNEKECIDPGNHHPHSLPERLQNQFSNDNLIVIDPTDKERNVASVLSTENYSKFVYNAWKYTENPSYNFFEPKAYSASTKELKKAMKKRGDIYVISFERPDDVTSDTLYPQLRRLMRRITDVIKQHEFELFDTGIYVENDVRLILETKVSELPPLQKHHGPQVFHNQENLANFTSKYDKTWIEGTQLTTIIEREFTSIKPLLKTFLSGNLQEKGIPAGLGNVVANRTIRTPQLDSKNWQKFLTAFLHIDSRDH